MTKRRNIEPERDDRPPICPACGVTMGIREGDAGDARYICLECGFADDGAEQAD